VHYGLYPSDKDPLDFSFSDVYDPVSFTNARFSEAHVWSIFSQAADQDGSFQLKFQDYASGRDLESRMPLFIEPYKKLSAFDVMNMMNSHYEGTELDGTLDTGGGTFGDPHRPRPLTWDYEGKKYFNERTVAIERTGWNFVAQLRPNMPRELSVLIWFASDDTSTSPRVPVYACSTTVADPYSGKGTQDGVPAPMMKLDLTKAFWVQNMVSNLAYSRWKDAYPIVRKRIDDIYFDHAKKVKLTDISAEAIYNTVSPEEAVKFATQVSVKMAESLHHRWMEFYGELFVRFRDFSTIVEDKENTRCGCDVKQPGISDEVKRRIVMETGDHYEVKEDSSEGPTTARLRSPDFGASSARVKAAV